MNKKKIVLISVAVFIVVSLIVTAIVLTNYKEFDVQYNAKDSTVTITYLGFVPMKYDLQGDFRMDDYFTEAFFHNDSITLQLKSNDYQISGLKYTFTISERLDIGQKLVFAYEIWSDGTITINRF